MKVVDQIEQLRKELADSYSIEREVGRGGMATVYLAHDLKLNRPVALKVLRPELAVTVGIERFNREVHFAAGLQHPHILPVYDSGSAGGLLYYVMPFVEGESLRDRLTREGKLSVEAALQIARDVAAGLDYAHSRGVIHRDVKPGNILLSGDHAVVTDFGIAKALSDVDGDQLTHTGIAVGTPAYMSPEQAASGGDIDGRSDIYSLGCVLFEMLAGEPPYRGTTARATIAQRFLGPAPSLKKRRGDVPGALDRVVSKAMSKLPSARYQTGTDFGKALGEALTGEVPAVKAKWIRAAALVAGAVALAASALWFKGSLVGSPVLPGTEVIAVMPFRASGTGVEVLGEGMVDLLSTNLDGVGGIRAVDPRVVLHRWRQEGGGAPLALEDALAVGRKVNAGAILRGSVVEAGPEVRITADLYSVSGEQLARVQSDGPADSVLALVDDVSVQLLREIWRSEDPLPDLRVSALTTTSLDAIRSFLRGEQFYRRSQWDSAVTAFGRSIEEDSTFALAYFKLSHTYGWSEGHGSPNSRELLGMAERYSARLPQRERTLIVAHRLFDDGRPEAVDTLRQYVVRHPEDAEGWYELGDAQYHARYALALSEAELLEPFERAMELDPTLVPSMIHPLELTLAIGDSARFQRYIQLMETSTTSGRSSLYRDMAAALWDTTAAGDSAMTRLLRENPGLVGQMVDAYYRTATVDPHRILNGLDSALASSQSDDGGAYLMVVKARFLSSLGRLAEARHLIDSVFQVNPRTAMFASLYPVIAGYADIMFALPGLRVLGAISESDPLAGFWRGVFLAGTGDVPNARVAVQRQLDLIGDSDTTAMRGLFDGLMGWVAVLEGDTVGGIARMERGLNDVGFAPGVSLFSGPLRFELATALTQRSESRSEGLRRLQYGVGPAGEYRALTYLALAQVFEEDGDDSGAIEAYSQFIRLWENADPQLQPAVESARRALRRLAGESVVPGS